MKKNIALVGFMGAGKTVVGKELSKRLGMRFVDSDDIIVEREHQPITDIFAKSGEVYFRKIEKEVIKDLCSKDGLVIACGGGVVLDKENMSNLSKNGVIIYLHATPNVIFQRTKSYKHRPLLNVKDPKKEIEKILESRMQFYNQADFTIDTSEMEVEDVVDNVLEIIKK
ncbi:MAG: shikimate kinase [Candidatus Omnitrophota bacterium]